MEATEPLPDPSSEPAFTHDPPGDGNIHLSPCDICRRRKVRCSKTEPCQNCQRAGAVCTYEDQDRISRRLPRHTELSYRLSRLEAAVRTSGTPPGPGYVPATSKQGADAGPSQRPAGQLTAPLRSLGKLAYTEGKSRHIQAGFWAGLYEEIETLKYLIEHESAPPEVGFLFSPSIPAALYPTSHPVQSISNFLVRSFTEHVDPFVRVLHKKQLLLNLSLFRRGTLEDAKDFECQLYIIYALGLVPLSPEECQLQLGSDKPMLMATFRAASESGLSGLRIASTHKIQSLQTFLLYITFLFWTGEMFHASGLLGLAIRCAQRLGLHRDGSRFNLSPWRVELRRRIWHHILLLDSWFIEHLGSESMILPGFSDTAFPQCNNDSSWDACDFALEKPSPSTAFTDMTSALVQYELAAVVKATHENDFATEEVVAYIQRSRHMMAECRESIESKYLSFLDLKEPSQKIILDLAALTFERMYFTTNQPLFKHGKGGDLATPDLQAELFDRAIAYCETLRNLRNEYSPHHLDWIIVRAFSWHAVTIMLTSLLQRYPDLTPQSQRARVALESVFQERFTIDFLAGESSLWLPLHRLWADLQALDHGNSSQDDFQTLGFSQEWLVNSPDAAFDPRHPTNNIPGP